MVDSSSGRVVLRCVYIHPPGGLWLWCAGSGGDLVWLVRCLGIMVLGPTTLYQQEALHAAQVRCSAHVDERRCRRRVTFGLAGGLSVFTFLRVRTWMRITDVAGQQVCWHCRIIF